MIFVQYHSISLLPSHLPYSPYSLEVYKHLFTEKVIFSSYLLPLVRYFNETEFIQFALNHVLSHGVADFPEEATEFSSGRWCNCKINWRGVMNDAALMDRLSDYVIAFATDSRLHPSCFYGVSEGTSKLGVITQFKWAKRQPDFGIKPYSLPMGRGMPKERGPVEEREFAGKPRGDTVILEDVATTVDSVLKEIQRIRNIPEKVIGVVVLTDRLELRDDGRSAREVIESLGIYYGALSDAFQLVIPAYEILKPGDEIARKVECYYDRYGIRPLRLLPR